MTDISSRREVWGLLDREPIVLIALYDRDDISVLERSVANAVWRSYVVLPFGKKDIYD